MLNLDWFVDFFEWDILFRQYFYQFSMVGHKAKGSLTQG
jgi:hypothetical protein